MGQSIENEDAWSLETKWEAREYARLEANVVLPSFSLLFLHLFILCQCTCVKYEAKIDEELWKSRR